MVVALLELFTFFYGIEQVFAHGVKLILPFHGVVCAPEGGFAVGRLVLGEELLKLGRLHHQHIRSRRDAVIVLDFFCGNCEQKIVEHRHRLV